jgi:hypothetical protein
MDRQEEVDEAVAEMAKPKHHSKAQRHHKHHKKHHAAAQTSEAPATPM